MTGYKEDHKNGDKCVKIYDSIPYKPYDINTSHTVHTMNWSKIIIFVIIVLIINAFLMCVYIFNSFSKTTN